MAGPLEGKTSFLVVEPTNPGRNITDIDRIEGRTLWEEKTAVDAKNRITGVDETGFLAKLFADLSQGLAFGVCELHTSLDLIAQDAVFCREILVSVQLVETWS